MKKTVQIYLDAKQERSLRVVSRRSGLSMAELIRRSIDRYLEEMLPPEEDPALGLIALGTSGRSDLSESHDKVLAGGLSGR